IKLHEPLEIRDRSGQGIGVFVEAFAVPGKVALYLEDAAAGDNFGTQPEDTIGLRIAGRDNASQFFYVPACATLTDDIANRLTGASLVLFDGTLWRDDEMIVAGVGTKTGRRMGHMSVSGTEGTMAAFAKLGVRRKIFVHMNNTNPILLGDTPERAAIAEAGWEAAYDGMEITL